MLPARPSNHPSLSNSSRSGDTFPSRMSTWFSHLLPSSSSTTVVESSKSPSNDISTSNHPSPARKPPSSAAFFLSAARQRAVDGVRHLLDSEAQPDKCPDTIWVLGVPHPGWRPSTPSPDDHLVDPPEAGEDGRRAPEASGQMSSLAKSEAGGLRSVARGKRKEPSVPTSPPKSFGSLFSSSTLSLALPASKTSVSPNRGADVREGHADSPTKSKNRNPEKEVIKWPDECELLHLSSLQAK